MTKLLSFVHVVVVVALVVGFVAPAIADETLSAASVSGGAVPSVPSVPSGASSALAGLIQSIKAANATAGSGLGLPSTAGLPASGTNGTTGIDLSKMKKVFAGLIARIKASNTTAGAGGINGLVPTGSGNATASAATIAALIDRVKNSNATATATGGHNPSIAVLPPKDGTSDAVAQDELVASDSDNGVVDASADDADDVEGEATTTVPKIAARCLRRGA